jgi:hypothetical protein
MTGRQRRNKRLSFVTATVSTLGRRIARRIPDLVYQNGGLFCECTCIEVLSSTDVLVDRASFLPLAVSWSLRRKELTISTSWGYYAADTRRDIVFAERCISVARQTCTSPRWIVAETVAIDGISDRSH